ncbi:MAG: hypothetical protein MJZ37_06405 [Bacilli bacterium]|nr:hypothetical protein [Bacilli bacterium]
MTLREFLKDHVQLDSWLFIMEDTDDDAPEYTFNGRMDRQAFLRYTNGELKNRRVLKFWFDNDGIVVIIISNHD